MPKTILKTYFGYDSFKNAQEEIINEILKCRDALGIMPTGAGKSICYQVPAIANEGITLVVSPLISLMQDQVKSLIQAGVSAAYINSSLSPKQIETALYNAAKGQYKIIYVAPERLLTDSFLNFAIDANIYMLTVDEAHCISQWGQDFRPSYAQIPEFIAKLKKRPVVTAFTATATERVKEDIIYLLELRNPHVVVSGFDRENLYFEVKSSSDKLYDLLRFLKGKEEESGIIYCATRKNVELVCDELIENGFSAAKYHAGMSQTERSKNQDDFIFDKISIIVATNAFGMGIDKSNVKYVVHYNMPKDMESYYQEAGRAGRDGSFAHCLMLYSGQDVITNQFLIEKGHEENGDFENSQELIENDYKRLKQITFYSTTNECLRNYILKYFGENPNIYCGNCGNCDTEFETIEALKEAQKIISCVIRTGERFGKVMIIDVLMGSKNKKVLQFGFDKIKTYGTSEMSAQRIRAITENLIVHGYLHQTDSQYSVIKTTEKSKEILYESTEYTVKLPKEQVPKIKSLSEKSHEKIKTVKNAKSRDLPEEKMPLFEKLRELRFKISSEEKVPPFMIFSDLSLIDMCNKLPVNEKQFIDVSGVGKQKLEKYGAVFTDEILQFCESNKLELPPDKVRISKEDSRIMALPSEDIINQIDTRKELLGVREIASLINEVLEFNDCNKISPIKTANWLVAKGYLEIVETDGIRAKVPSKKGFDEGIIQQERTGHTGTYNINLYPENIQKLIVENVLEII